MEYGNRHRRYQHIPLLPGTGSDKNEQFIFKNMTQYFIRLLDVYQFDDKDLEILCLILGADMRKVMDYVITLMKIAEKKKFEDSIHEPGSTTEEITDTVKEILPCFNGRRFFLISAYIIELLEQKVRRLKYRGKSEAEKKIEKLQEMFSLTAHEVDFLQFLFIVSAWHPAESYFVDNLGCQTVAGRKYLLTLLQITSKDLGKVLSGTLARVGIFEMDNFNLELSKDFMDFFLKSSAREMTTDFFTPLHKKAIPLECHLIDKQQTDYTLKLLKDKSGTSVHILLYGSPGTGKTSYACGLVKKLNVPGYEIKKDEENKTSKRRAAITACINMTNSGKGSVIVVDEADNLLNTECSWLMRGETQDKGWLNHLMEEPGIRMIWITNSIDNIEPSVLRRFSLSIHFRQFSHKQRIQVWNSVLRENRARRFFTQEQIRELAKRYKVSAGAVDLAVKNALKKASKTKEEFHRAVALSLDSHTALLNAGEKPREKDRIEKNYSMDGLNVQGDIQAMMARLEKFDVWLRQPDAGTRMNMNLLFYGPPGTGKSELARFIAEHLRREIICRRASDIISMWVGSTEQNIKRAFEEAEREEAVLVIDEADTFLFAREQAQRSWEISFTNEFLTQMERFKGILICTTNRLEGLDEASIRRFNHKVGFDFLTPDGNVIFYRKLLAQLTNTPLDEPVEKTLRALPDLAPGDFRVVRDRYSFERPEQVNHKILVQALREESQVKRMQRGEKQIGF